MADEASLSPERRSAVAVALGHDAPDATARVVAKGYGTLADDIIRTARAHNLYVHTAPELVALLQQIDLDAHIPPILYDVVAELLAWLIEQETTQEPAQETTHADAQG